VEAAIATAFREEWGRVVATLIRVTGDWDLAEECAQDAFAQALVRWPQDGVPLRPGAWLTRTGRNRAIDRLRRKATEATKLAEVAAMMSPDRLPGGPHEADESGVQDDRLRLIFTCCHPALAVDARVALTLRTLTGLTTAEIGRAFLVSEVTMAKRLVRAKQKIKNAGIPYRVPPAHMLPERLSSVLAVMYLLFNEGYTASSGSDLVRQALCAEAIRLARLLEQLMPDEPEVHGLTALMLFQDARRPARIDDDGELVPLSFKTEPDGTGARSPRASRSWRTPPDEVSGGPTGCRPRSPPATSPRTRLLSRTGAGSPNSTESSSAWFPRRW
jgi:RNA polymerase sigma-70 factor (ECF subfamily)